MRLQLKVCRNAPGIKKLSETTKPVFLLYNLYYTSPLFHHPEVLTFYELQLILYFFVFFSLFDQSQYTLLLYNTRLFGQILRKIHCHQKNSCVVSVAMYDFNLHIFCLYDLVCVFPIKQIFNKLLLSHVLKFSKRWSCSFILCKNLLKELRPCVLT